MTKYIDADKLITAIEMRLKNLRGYINGVGMKYKGPKFYKARGKESVYDELLSIIYFLQQEQPEVDLEKELDKWRHDHFKGKRDGDYNGEYLERESQLNLARHFVEFGLNARNK